MSETTTKETAKSNRQVEVKTKSADKNMVSEWTYRPNIDILESDKVYQIIADIPGAEQESVDLIFEDNMLTMEAAIRPRINEDINYLLHEFGIGNFQRRVKISEDIEVNDIQAGYDNGVLTVTLPKKLSTQRRQIEIKAG